MSTASVFGDVKSLSSHLSITNGRVFDVQEATKIIFERLLTWDEDEASELSKVLPLANFSYFYRSTGCAEHADSLDAAVEKLYNIGDGLPVDAFQRFLGKLANIVERETTCQRPRFFEFSESASDLSILTKTAVTNRILTYQWQPDNIRNILPRLENVGDFPTMLPCFSDSVEDEGLSDASSLSPSPKEPPKKKIKHGEILVSQMNTKDFDCFWQSCLRHGPYRLLSQEKLAEISSVSVTFDEFRRCFQSLLSGIPSWMFPISNDQFELESKVRVIGISAVAFRQLMRPYLGLGNSVYALHVKWLEQTDSIRQPTLQAFQLGLISILRDFQWESARMCAGAKGVLDLVRTQQKYCTLFRQLTEFCHLVRARLESKNFTVKWLLDSLLDLCTGLRFSPISHQFFVQLFKHTLQAQLKLLNALATDTATAIECKLEELFVKVNQDAILLNDRRFWTEAITMDKEAIPVIFTSSCSCILWTAKMSVLVYRMGIQGPLGTDVNERAFSLVELANEGCMEVIHENTLDEIGKNIEREWRRKAELMRNFINTGGVFGKIEFQSLCSNLRSIFLLANTEFSSILVEELFHQLTMGHRSVSPKEFFDIYSLNRALERALKAKSLSKDIGKLDLSFVIESDDTADHHSEYLTILDRLKLDCTIPWPENIAISISAVDWYRKPFGLLFKLELTFWILSKSRTQLMMYSKWKRVRLGRTLMQLREIDLFARNLRIYLLHQVVEICWTRFAKKLSKLVNNDELDGMYEIHNRYVSDFINRCLLNPKAKQLLNVVEKLLKYATEFGLIALILLEKEEGKGDSEVEEKMKKLETLHGKFTKTLKLFYDVLCKLASRGYQPHLVDLLMRMNYNYYYESVQYNQLHNSRSISQFSL